jgi:pyruvate dehydrogenase E1 component alpha subunit
MLPKETMLRMYKTMLKIREFDSRINELLKQGLMFGFSHQYIGEEAVAVGSCDAINTDDYITSTHRGHGHCIAKGARLDKMMAELMGRKTGYCKGKGGSMHIADIEVGNLGANGIVGGGIPIAVGAALKAKLKKTGQVAISFFGDGASNQGVLHESMNLASIWKLPVIFLCENNKYGMTMSVKKSINIENIAERAKGYGIPGIIIDGNDVEEVYNAVKEAAERARRGEGPTMIEAKTYRWKGHSTNDLCVYRTEDEVEEWKKKCPIKRLKDKLLKIGVGENELSSIEEAVKQELKEAEDFAINSPYPDPSEAMEDLFA